MRIAILAAGLFSVTAAVGVTLHKQGDANGQKQGAPGQTSLTSGAMSGAPVSDVPSIAVNQGKKREERAKVELARLAIDDEHVQAVQPDGSMVPLTLSPAYQRLASKVLASHHFPEAAMVVADPITGKILAYASHTEAAAEAAKAGKNEVSRDLCREAIAPSASVFKIITASALLSENVGIHAETQECFPDGGEQRLTNFHLRVDPKRDRYCAALSYAMAKSTNPVFARLASRFLTPEKLSVHAKKWGYGSPLSFDTAMMPSDLSIPSDPLAFARTAAGFWNTTLSPVHAVWLSSVIANEGVAPPLRIVERSDENRSGERIVSKEHAAVLRQLLSRTIPEGTGRKAFHDAHGLAYLPNIQVFGKTGTLTDALKQRYYTWFTGFSVPSEKGPEVAISVLVVNGPSWKTKANVVAREFLQGMYAAEGLPHVHPPLLAMPKKARKAVPRTGKPSSH